MMLKTYVGAGTLCLCKMYRLAPTRLEPQMLGRSKLRVRQMQQGG